MEFANKASRIGPIPSTGSLSDRIVVSQGTRQVQSPLEVYSGLRFTVPWHVPLRAKKLDWIANNSQVSLAL